MTRAQLDQLSMMLRPIIARFLDEPVSDTTVAIACTPVPDDPDGAAVMRFEVKVRGESIPPEQDEKLAQFLRSSENPQIVKTKAG